MYFAAGLISVSCSLCSKQWADHPTDLPATNIGVNRSTSKPNSERSRPP